MILDEITKAMGENRRGQGARLDDTRHTLECLTVEKKCQKSAKDTGARSVTLGGVCSNYFHITGTKLTAMSLVRGF